MNQQQRRASYNDAEVYTGAPRGQQTYDIASQQQQQQQHALYDTATGGGGGGGGMANYDVAGGDSLANYEVAAPGPARGGGLGRKASVYNGFDDTEDC
jgi:hypothetical protein